MASLRRGRDQGETDLGAWEEAIRNAVLRYGAQLLEGLLAEAGCGRRKEPLLDPDGQPMQSIGVRSKTITTLLGEVTLRRSVFEDKKGSLTRIPMDESLGVEGTSFSPGVWRFMARAGSMSSFAQASQDLAIYAHLVVTPKQVQRVAEDVGREVEDWINRQGFPNNVADDPAPVPILYVSFDGTGVPMTYVGAIESSQLFGLRIYQEAVRRGCEQSGQIVVFTDGARYNKTISSTHFPGAIHIIDLYHAREHLTDLSKDIGADQAQLSAWKDLLDMGRVEELIQEASSRIDNLPIDAQAADECRKHLPYFRDNAEAMRYAQFRRAGNFVGSGVIEAGCRTVVGQRLKHSGMFWSLRGANAIIASRCCQLSGRLEDFWEEAA